METTTNAVWQAAELAKRYGRTQALHDVNFTVQPGRFLGLLGPNGAGKSTLLKLTAGLLTPTAGAVRVCGFAPGIESKRLVSYLPDRVALSPALTAADLTAMWRDFYPDFDAAKAGAMLADLKLDPRQRLGAMSKGTQEKVQLCLVMSRAAKLYLLDEPLGGVDPAAREYILHTILRSYSEDAVIVLSTHLIGDIEKVLDEVLLLKDGTVLCHRAADDLRAETGKSVDEYFKEVFKC